MYFRATYQVSIQIPQGFVLTIPNAGNDDVDSDFVLQPFLVSL